MPSSRTVLLSAAVGAVAVAGYVAAETTSVFAVRTIEVRGASSPLAADVQRALRGVVGTSLLDLDREEVHAVARAVPGVAATGSDRLFPNTLVVVVEPERAAAVARHGAASWLLSIRGRVLAQLERGQRPDLPRVWVPKDVRVARGTSVAGHAPTARALRALVPVVDGEVPLRVRAVVTEYGALRLRLASGVELRLGDASAAALKLVVAHEVLRKIPRVEYVDVSLPSRPVIRYNPQPEG